MPPIKRLNRNYKKGGAYKDSRKFIIICEGIREARYFGYFKSKYKSLVIEIIEPKGVFEGHSAPKKLLERASEFINREGWDENLDDEMWFIADTDRWGYQLHLLADHVRNTKNWFLANSNPCFEVWLIYHRSSEMVDIKDPKGVKEKLHGQVNGGYRLETYIVDILKAIEVAKSLDRSPDQHIAEQGVTKVYKLGEKLLELIPMKDGFLDL